MKGVREGNTMAVRIVLAVAIMAVKGVLWLIEQPSSSLFRYHPAFVWLQTKIPIVRQFVWLGSYGAASPKGIHLYGMHPCIHGLYKPLPNRLWKDAKLITNKSVDSSGRLRCSGGPMLKQSQAYPHAFGRAIQKLWVANQEALALKLAEIRHTWLSTVGSELTTLDEETVSHWELAKLDSILEKLMR